MSRYKDFTGVGNTCPYIDEVIDAVRDVSNWGELSNGYHSLEALEQNLEAIRHSNEQLRDFGNEWFKASEEFEKEMEAQKAINEDLEMEIENLKNENEELQTNLSNIVYEFNR